LANAKSVAVLPFANLSDDKANEYFSDGISEELLNLLARVPGLRVAARTSSFFFKGRNEPIAEIAQKLGVAYVVEGSVRKAGDRVRIVAQLVKAADGFPVWSDTFDRGLTNIFALQDEIAGLIAQNLRLEMGMTAAARGEIDPEAYQLYLEGRQAWNRRTTVDLERAEQCFERALAREPDFTRAILGRADVWIIRGMEQQEIVEFGRRQSPGHARLVAEIERALGREPDLAEAHASLGTLHWLGWRFGEAERALRRALTLEPNYATAHLWLGRVLQADGRLDEALVELKAAVDLDPLSSRLLDNYSNALLLAERTAEGLAAAERALALQPDNIQARARIATALTELGRKEEAMVSAVMLVAARPMRVTEAGYVFARCGLTASAETQLARLREIQPKGIALAYVLAALDRHEEALAALEPATLQSTLIDYLYYWPVFDPVRADPRFRRTLAAVGMSEAHDRAQAGRAARQRAKAVKR
jgi:TolB-like protein/Flp pilus assembly protein TadD